jgi:hypothetical protein
VPGSVRRLVQKSGETEERQSVNHLPRFRNAPALYPVDEHCVCRKPRAHRRSTEQRIARVGSSYPQTNSRSAIGPEDVFDVEAKVWHRAHDHSNEVGPAPPSVAVGEEVNEVVADDGWVEQFRSPSGKGSIVDRIDRPAH